MEHYSNVVKAMIARSNARAADIADKIQARAYYQFQYVPPAGPLPGWSMEQQTEDAINEIGNIAYSSDEIAREAREIAQQAYNAAQAAIEMATNAITAAQNAQQTADTALNTANTAVSKADNAQASADAAQKAADAAQKSANDAQTSADNAQSTANTAIENASQALSAANEAKASADQSNQRLDVLEPIVDTLRWYENVTDNIDFNTHVELERAFLQGTANTNGPIPGPGWLDVDDDYNETYIRQKFIAQADGACYVRFGTIVPDSSPIEVSSWTGWVKYALASELTSAVETINTSITSAITAAQNAQQTADTALNTANTAVSKADNAQASADAAQKAADAAQKSANDAQTSADNAQSTANTAIENASQALSAANEAKASADQSNQRLDVLEPIVDTLRWYENVTDNIDFNTHVELERAFLQGTANTNGPIPGPGWLDVDDDYNETYIRQKFIAQADGACYVRFGTIVPDSSPIEVSSWTGWVKYALASELTSAVETINTSITSINGEITTIKGDITSIESDITELQGSLGSAEGDIAAVTNALDAHKADYDNPHKVTAAQLGLATVYKYKGSVETYADLPTSDQQVGDVYNVKQADPDHNIEAGDNVAWDGTTWDILAGDTDLSGYAQLNSANTFTAMNAFRANIAVSNGAAGATGGTIRFGISPTGETVQARISADTLGGLFYNTSTNQPHVFRVGNNLNSFVIRDDGTTTAFSNNNHIFASVVDASGNANWLGNANTATKLATARTINGVPFDGTQNITIEAGRGKFLPLTGGTVTGPIYLPSTAPTTDTQAVTKKYVDDSVAGAGGGYAQLNSANTFTAMNAFRANIAVSNGAAGATGGTIRFGISPTGETVQARISADTLGGLFYNTSTNQPHVFRVGNNLNSFVIRDDGTTTAFSNNNHIFASVVDASGNANWLGNANTATKLATARTINGVPFDGTQNITIEAGRGKFLPLTGGTVTGPIYLPSTAPTTDTQAVTKKYVDDSVAGAGGGYAQLNSANTFTGTNTFNKPITVRNGALAGIGGTITLGTKPNSATTQAKINSAATGAMYYTATEGLAHFFNVGTAEVATIGGTATKATLDFLANSILKYSTSSGLRVGGGGTSQIIGFYPEAADNTAGMRLSNQAEAISTDYSIFSLQNNSAISYTKNAALQVGNFKILEVDRNNNNVTIKADSNGQILFTPNNLASNTSSIDSNGNFYISQGLTVGSTLNTGTSNGVIRAGNNESCLYFTGTAENTYFSAPNTGNIISYQAAANVYLINTSINNAASLTMNFSNMSFHATVGSVPYMCKTLTFWFATGATAPTVTWRFPSGAVVYYPKGVAPSLTANASNIINVVAIVDDTDIFSIQVCDVVALPYSG